MHDAQPTPPVLTPRTALKAYRQSAPPQMRADVETFNAMSVSDRLELLFFMCRYAGWSIEQIAQHLGGETAPLPAPQQEH